MLPGNTNLDQHLGASKKHFFGLMLPHFSYFSSFLHFSCKKFKKRIFTQAVGVFSAQTLVEIYNIGVRGWGRLVYLKNRSLICESQKK